jgi:hypothetical protein
MTELALHGVMPIIVTNLDCFATEFTGSIKPEYSKSNRFTNSHPWAFNLFLGVKSFSPAFPPSLTSFPYSTSKVIQQLGRRSPRIPGPNCE